MKTLHQCLVAVMLLACAMPGAAQRRDASPSDVAISGELKQWHKVTLTLTGPQADESSTEPNPFTDYRMTVTFAHESGTPTYRVPGYFAGDGNAANSSATSGNKWRAHVAQFLQPPRQLGDIGWRGWRANIAACDIGSLRRAQKLRAC